MIYDKPLYEVVVTGTQPKPTKQRVDADTTQEVCYFCHRAKDEEKGTYYVERGKILEVDDHNMAEIEIPYKVRYHPDRVWNQSYRLFLNEFGSTPEQAVENML